MVRGNEFVIFSKSEQAEQAIENFDWANKRVFSDT